MLLFIKLSEKMKDVFEDIVGEKYNSNYDFMQYIKTTFNKISKEIDFEIFDDNYVILYTFDN